MSKKQLTTCKSPSFDWFFLCFYKNSEEKQTKTKKSHKKQDFRMRG
jgi:hypothetical protein